jgi:hypothetical protein
MMTTTKVPAPAGLKRSGRALWRSVLAVYELETHEAQLLTEMCRTVDQLDALFVLVERDGLQDEARRVNPALVEARQLRIAYARLSAALRLPAGEDGEQVRRPQRRVGARGVYVVGDVS